MRRPGTGTALRAALLAAAAAAIVAFPAGANPGDATVTTSIATGHQGGAAKADALTIFNITGTDAPQRVNAFTGPGGRLTLVSPEGIVEPDGPNPQCTQDSATQVSCDPGFVDVLAGDLLGGADIFSAAPSLMTQIGADLVGPDRPLGGGSGRDQLNGGAFRDLLEGDGGRDVLNGGGSTDVLRGGAGKDDLRGAGAADALFGGGGPDNLHGGGGRDLCNGGGGVDRGVSCTVAKKIP